MNWRNKDWEPQSFAICMAWDAFRIALGGKPQHFTLKEVLVWLQVRAALSEVLK